MVGVGGAWHSCIHEEIPSVTCFFIVGEVRDMEEEGKKAPWWFAHSEEAASKLLRQLQCFFGVIWAAGGLLAMGGEGRGAREPPPCPSALTATDEMVILTN